MIFLFLGFIFNLINLYLNPTRYLILPSTAWIFALFIEVTVIFDKIKTSNELSLLRFILIFYSLKIDLEHI